MGKDDRWNGVFHTGWNTRSIVPDCRTLGDLPDGDALLSPPDLT